jgi:hypothetical protein
VKGRLFLLLLLIVVTVPNVNAATLFLRNSTTLVTINDTASFYTMNQTSLPAKTLAHDEVSNNIVNFTFYEDPVNSSQMRNMSGTAGVFVCLNVTAAAGSNGARAWLYNYSTYTGSMTKIGQTAYFNVTTTAACIARQLTFGVVTSKFLPTGSRLAVIIQLQTSAIGRVKMWYEDGSTPRFMGNFTIANLSFHGDLLTPNYTRNYTNTTRAGEAALFMVDWQDENQLWGYVFEYDDGSGTMVNDSLVNFYDKRNQTNVTKILPAIGSVVRWRVYANDTQGNMNATQINTFIAADPHAINRCGGLPYTGAEEGFNSLYTLNKSISATINCITFTHSNITLDCEGYNITYATTSAGVGINYSTVGLENITIRGCRIGQSGVALIDSPAIYLNGTGISNSINVTIINTTITTNGTRSHGLRVVNANNITLIGVTIRTNRTNSDAVSLLNVDRFNATLCTFITNGTNADGINATDSTNLFIDSTTILTNSTNASGIYLLRSSNITVIDSEIATNDTNASGIYALYSFGLSVSSSAIFTNGRLANALTLLNTSNGTFTHVVLNASFLPTAGFTRAYAAYLYGSNMHNFTNTTFDSFSAGYNSTASADNALTQSVMHSCNNGCDTNYADVFLKGDSNVTIVNTTFNLTAVGWSAGWSNNFTVKWFVRVNVTWENNTAISNALVNITNTTGSFTNPMWKNLVTDVDGVTPWVEVTQVIGNNTFNNTYTPHNFTANATNSLVNSTNATVNFSQTVWIVVSNDTEPPNWSGNTTSGRRAATNITFSAYWTDNVQFESYIFEFDNGSGVLVNDSAVDFTGNANWSNVTKFVNLSGYSSLRWRYYVTDTEGNMNASALAFINYTLNPVGGTENYTAYRGQVFMQLNGSGNSAFIKPPAGRIKNATIYITRSGSPITWSRLRTASLADDMPAMDTFLNLVRSQDKLAWNYNATLRNTCRLANVNVMNSSDNNSFIGSLYSDQDNSGTYTGGDSIIFCANVNYNAMDYTGTVADYEIVFPGALGRLDTYLEAG